MLLESAERQGTEPPEALDLMTQGATEGLSGGKWHV